MKSSSELEFAALLRPGMRVFLPGSSGEPGGLLDALAAHPEAAAGVTFVQFPIPGMNTTDFTSFHPSARMETFFMTPQLQDGFAAGRVAFVPMQLRRVFDYLQRGPAFDFVWLQVAPPDENGRYGLAPNVDFASAALANAKAVVAEINAGFRAPLTSLALPAQRIDYVLHTNHPLRQQAATRIDAVAQAIGTHVATLVRDGDCVQTGIGQIPAAVLAALSERNDLGLHSGLIDPSVQALIERGVITGQAKTLDRGLHVTGAALGDTALYDWLATQAAVAFRPASHTHEISAMRQIDNFVSINSAVEVDLYGQVNAEMIGTRQVSGTGGAVDFMRGAAASNGGRSIVALLATAREGAVSRIVPALSTGTAATAARTDVDYVITEFGVAHLWGASQATRAAALIDIAAPAHRDALRDAWRKLGKL